MNALYNRGLWLMYAIGFFLMGMPTYAWAADGKTTETQDSLLLAMEKAEGAAKVLGEKLTQLGDKYGPSVVDLALGVARIDAIRGIVSGMLALIFAYVSYRAGMFIYNKGEGHGGDGLEFIPIVILGVFSGFALFFGITHVFDVWAWAGIYDPKLYLAYKFLFAKL